jgi:hypothetical protein
MDGDDDGSRVSVRIAQLFLMQLLVTPVVFLAIRLKLPTLFAMLLVTALVALTANPDWAPATMATAVFAAVLLPFVASLCGLALGYALFYVFDHFRADEEATRTPTVVAQRVAMLVLAAVLIGANLMVIAVPRSALVACIIAHIAIAALVFAGLFIASRGMAQLKKAWILYAILYELCFAISSFTLAFSDSMFWTFFMIAISFVLALIIVLVTALLFSNDARSALSEISNMGNTPAPSSSSQVAPASSAGPSNFPTVTFAPVSTTMLPPANNGTTSVSQGWMNDLFKS